MPRNYINLTSGIECLPLPDFRLVRIQSSQLESYALWNVIVELDYGFLFDAAMDGVNLYDCGSRRSAVSRAQWQGVRWITYAYNRANGGDFSGEQWHNDFDCVYRASSKGLRAIGLKKLRYVHKMTGRPLSIECVSSVSTMDGDYSSLAAILKANNA